MNFARKSIMCSFLFVICLLMSNVFGQESDGSSFKSNLEKEIDRLGKNLDERKKYLNEIDIDLKKNKKKDIADRNLQNETDGERDLTVLNQVIITLMNYRNRLEKMIDPDIEKKINKENKYIIFNQLITVNEKLEKNNNSSIDNLQNISDYVETLCLNATKTPENTTEQDNGTNSSPATTTPTPTVSTTSTTATTQTPSAATPTEKPLADEELEIKDDGYKSCTSPEFINEFPPKIVYSSKKSLADLKSCLSPNTASIDFSCLQKSMETCVVYLKCTNNFPIGTSYIRPTTCSAVHCREITDENAKQKAQACVNDFSRAFGKDENESDATTNPKIKINLSTQQ